MRHDSGEERNFLQRHDWKSSDNRYYICELVSGKIRSNANLNGNSAGIQEMASSEPVAHGFVRKIIVLAPFLPSEKILRGFEMARVIAEQYLHSVDFIEPPVFH